MIRAVRNDGIRMLRRTHVAPSNRFDRRLATQGTVHAATRP